MHRACVKLTRQGYILLLQPSKYIAVKMAKIPVFCRILAEFSWGDESGSAPIYMAIPQVRRAMPDRHFPHIPK